jgi:hypothetical protein
VTDYREPDIYPPVPENLQKIPSNTIAVHPTIPLYHRRNASQPRNCALSAFGRFPEATLRSIRMTRSQPIISIS